VLAAHYQNADVYVCLSEHEGFCVPLLESMHHHVPVVAFDATAVPETLDGAGICLPDKAPAVIAQAVHRVVTDDELRAKLLAAGERRLSDFTLERSRARFLEAMAPVLDGAVR
jgi:glycosyltransferase involved in cell wall biosynthesis